MSAKFKPLAGQVIVVTGAGSGLGLEVARLAARAGAAVVLAGGDEGSVRAACEEIGKAGGRCHPVAADTSRADGCDRVARAAVARFGRIDSWIAAGGGEAELAQAAGALVNQRGEREEPVALVGFGARIGREARTELRQARGRIAVTLIKLPRDWRPDSPARASRPTPTSMPGCFLASLRAVSRWPLAATANSPTGLAAACSAASAAALAGLSRRQSLGSLIRVTAIRPLA
jgi:NAD(P)-dependent dehydrogenase (short-subunit alcohol dehydrogenase family)